MNTENDFATVLCEGTMKAAALIIQRRKLTLSESQLNEVVTAMREVVKAGYDKALAEAKEALEVLRSGQWAHESVNASCYEFAYESLEKCGFVPAKTERNISGRMEPVFA